MNEKPAKLGNLCHRLSTVLSLVLTVTFFVLSRQVDTVRLVLFLLWTAYSGYSTVKLISDLVGGQNLRTKNFAAMLDRWEARTGSRAKSLRVFTAISAITAIVKLGIPFLLWLL